MPLYMWYATGYTPSHARELARAFRQRGARVRQRRAFLRVVASQTQVSETLALLYRTGDAPLTVDRV